MTGRWRLWPRALSGLFEVPIKDSLSEDKDTVLTLPSQSLSSGGKWKPQSRGFTREPRDTSGGLGWRGDCRVAVDGQAQTRCIWKVWTMIFHS